MTKLIFTLSVCALALSAQSKKYGYNLPKDFAYVPSGSISNCGKPYSVQAFYMLDHEVTNFEYLEFLKSLATNKKTNELKIALPDTLQWNEIGGFHKAMVDHYLRHPAYAEYPVVNVSREAAKLYCKWLTETLRSENELLINDFRLPTRQEWMYAASSGKNGSIYSWDGTSLKTEKGEPRANYLVIGDQNISKNEKGEYIVVDTLRVTTNPDDLAFITVTKEAYGPNDFGLYNMCGNVGEWVAKSDLAVGGDWKSPGYDIRIESQKEAAEQSPLVGFRPVVTYLRPGVARP